MRERLIGSSVASVAMAVLVVTAATAIDSATVAATPTTTPPGLDVLTGMELDQDQIECLLASFEEFDVDDPAAMSDVLAECAVSTEELQIGEEAIETSLPGDTIASDAGAGDIDAETAAAVLGLLGLDATTVDCVVAEVGDLVPADDPTAESVFITCGVGPLQILNGIVALDVAVGGVEVPDDTSIETLAPPASTTSTGGAILDTVLDTLATFGITVDDEQRQCLLDNVADLELSDLSGSLSVLETCGIEVTDLIPGG